MQNAHARSQKTKATPKMTDHGVTVAVRSKKANPKVRPGSGPDMGEQERQMLVARAAYFRAEKRGFAPGGELQDWVEAEAEVL